MKIMLSTCSIGKIFSLRSKNNILLKRLIHHFVVPLPPLGKA